MLTFFTYGLQVLAEGLRACEDCGLPLDLSATNRETRDGLASILYLPCKCGVMNKVYTSKSHRDQDKCIRGKPIYDVNSKLAIGRYFVFKFVFFVYS
jgi:hypothetical protein